MNNFEETDRKDQIMKRNVEARYLRRQKKLQQGICLNNTTKVQLSPEKYRYLEWTEKKR